MKVLMVSSSYPRDVSDWRGRFIRDLAFAMARQQRVRLRLWAPPGEMPAAAVYTPTQVESAWLRAIMDSGGLIHLVRSDRLKGVWWTGNLLWKLRSAYLRNEDADIFHVNWLQNALGLWRIDKPTVISVLGSDYGLLKLPGMVPCLRGIIRQRCCILAPNADWMVQGLERYFGDIAEIRPIAFGVRQMWFDLERKQRPQAPRKWIVVSRVTEKKIGALFSWGEGLFEGDDELHLLGPMQEQIALPAWVRYHGPTHPAELKDEWFSWAAGLITLSDHDEGRPQVMLEAMAAGLPIIASNIAAHRNMIEHGQTGWIAKNKQEFQEGLRLLSQAEINGRIGMAASAWVRQHIGTWDDCAARYVAAYEKLVGMRR